MTEAPNHSKIPGNPMDSPSGTGAGGPVLLDREPEKPFSQSEGLPRLTDRRTTSPFSAPDASRCRATQALIFTTFFSSSTLAIIL